MEHTWEPVSEGCLLLPRRIGGKALSTVVLDKKRWMNSWIQAIVFYKNFRVVVCASASRRLIFFLKECSLILTEPNSTVAC